MITLWAAVWSCGMFGLLKCCGKLRVTEQQELKGETSTRAEIQTLHYALQKAAKYSVLVLRTSASMSQKYWIFSIMSTCYNLAS